MNTVTSKDGTNIAYDKIGRGPAVILVAGALCSRSFWFGPELAKLLAPYFTVYNYDRRGRGDSGDTKPYGVEREVEDIEALIDEAGGAAYLYGHSSGASLALEAAIKLGGKVKKLAMYEAPYNDDDEARRAWKEYTNQLTNLLAANRRGDAVALFMKLTGTPVDQIEGMRHAPVWPVFEAIAPTLAYDHCAILGEDGSVPSRRAASVIVPTLVMNGGASYAFMYDTARALSKAMPHAQLRTLEGQTHNVDSKVLALALVEFFPELQTLMTGLVLGESPRWHDDRLWFSDWGAHEVIAVDLAGKSEVIVRVPSFPFCIDFLPNGCLLIVSGGNGLLMRRELDGSLVTHGDLTSLSGHPWNEIVVDGRGNAYINNIGFDFPGGEFATGIIALVTPDGSLRQVADGVAFPNGMVVTPDNATLILAESYGQRLTAFDIAADGSLSNRRVWADLDGGAPDGICLDAENAVWYADVPNKRCVRVREGGEVLQTVDLDRGCFACMLGGVDNRTLFLMANEWPVPANMAGDGVRTGQVLTLEVPAPGAGWP